MKPFCRILLSTLMVIIFMVKMSKTDCRICKASKLPGNICQNAAGQNCTCNINSFDRSCMRQSGSYYVCTGPTGCGDPNNCYPGTLSQWRAYAFSSMFILDVAT